MIYYTDAVDVLRLFIDKVKLESIRNLLAVYPPLFLLWLSQVLKRGITAS